MQESCFPYKNEVYRKLLHVSGLWMSFALWFLDVSLAQALFLSVFFLVALFEVLRKIFGKTLLISFFPILMRPSETVSGELTGAFYMMLGASIVSFLFPSEIAATSLAILAISDSIAALVGRRWGKHKIAGKSLEGGGAFFCSAFAITLLTPAIEEFSREAYVFSCFLSCFVTMLLELNSKRFRIDDNFLVPTVFATSQTFFLFLATWIS